MQVIGRRNIGDDDDDERAAALRCAMRRRLNSTRRHTQNTVGASVSKVAAHIVFPFATVL